MNTCIAIITILLTTAAILVLPAIGSAVLFEWGFSRWEKKKFCKKRCFTFLLLALAVRLLLFTLGK